MKKSQLIECILEMNSSLPKLALSKFKKHQLETIYNSLLKGENVNDLMTTTSNKKQNKKEEKKEVKIIDFSSDEDTEVQEDNYIEELPPPAPVLKRQNAETKPSSIIQLRKQLREMTHPFSLEVKNITMEFKQTGDKDLLLHQYEILLHDTEEMLNEYLSSIDAENALYNYSADLLEIHSRFIDRIAS